MANDTVSSLGAAFKVVQRDHMADDVPKAAGPLAERVRKSAKKIMVGGKDLNATWSHKKYPGVGQGGLSEGGDFPTPLASAWASPALGLAHAAFAIGVTGHALAMGSGPEVSFMRRKLLTEKTEELRDKAGAYMGRFMVNDGTTNFAQINGSVSSHTFAIDAGSIWMFRDGEVIGSYATSNGTTDKFTDGTIVKVDYQNSQITVTDAGTASDNDYLAIKGFRGFTVPNGIRNLFGSATGTVQGINRATAGNQFAIPNVLSLSGAMTPSMADQIRDLVKAVGGQREDSYNSVFASNLTVRQWATLATIGQNRFTDLGNLQIGNAGMKVADVNGKKDLLEDPYLRDGEIFVIDPTKCVLAYPQGMEGGYFVENPSGDIFFQQTAASGAGYADAQLAYYIVRYNLGADSFRCQGYGSGFVSP